ncbi:MAG: hypothetical protein KIT80_02620 [Chitinophagaceae bacterium]|nr:hypothetical protein [Chitinophagaceae bacterium]MCW5925780.1 hypothetical protein [Chitinophagaceae bacterium]
MIFRVYRVLAVGVVTEPHKIFLSSMPGVFLLPGRSLCLGLCGRQYDLVQGKCKNVCPAPVTGLHHRCVMTDLLP